MTGAGRQLRGWGATWGVILTGLGWIVGSPAFSEDASRAVWPESLENGAFRDGTVHWRTHAAKDGGVSLAMDNERLHAGNPSLRVETVPSPTAGSVYQTVPVEGGRLYEVRVVYAAGAQKGETLEMRLAFSRPGGGNGSAGSSRWSLPPGKEGQWREFRKFVYVPQEAAHCQWTLSLKGGATAWIGEASLKLEETYTVGATSVPPSLNGEGQALATWKGSSELRGFWQVGKVNASATCDTRIAMTYDENALYLRMVNEEPHLGDLKVKARDRDGDGVYHDDGNEVFIAVAGGVVRQFITNAAGTQWDATLYQKAAGDPFRPDVKWNGSWKSRVILGEGEWISEWAIPWTDLGIKPSAGTMLRINFGRLRQTGIREVAQWNYFDGGFNTVDKYAVMTFRERDAQLVRFVEPVVEAPLRVERPVRRYRELLGERDGGYLVGDWAYAYYLASYPAAFQQRYDQESWRPEQVRYLEETGKLGMFGPAFPWAPQAGWPELEQVHREWGMRFPIFMSNSEVNRIAREKGATLVCPRTGAVTDFDPTKAEAMVAFTRDYLARHPKARAMLLAFKGTDEPTNYLYTTFSRTLRPDAGSVLDEVEEEIRSTQAGGEHGLYDHYNPQAASAPEAPLRRIAFNRWWSAKMGVAAEEIGRQVRELAPGIPFLAFQHNGVSGMTSGDIRALSRGSDWVSVDPYPTATLRFYGQARALYHTGFSTKFVHDLSGGKATQVILQGFEYHGRTPGREEVREWASQALKNGATILNWYTAGPLRHRHPEVYDEVLAINAQAHAMKELRFPDSPRTAIIFSNSSQAGLDDPVLHATYSLYALLGERLGTWFRFVGETGIGEEADALKGYDLVYLPQATYFSRAAARAIRERVEQGATLVIFDPRAFLKADDGGDLADVRQALVGTGLGAPMEAGAMRTVAGGLAGWDEPWGLPLTPVANLAGLKGVQAFSVTSPVGARVIAAYADGSPAAFLRKVGKGRVLYFAAQPFGDSALALAESHWPEVLRALAREAGEPTDLPLWDFYLEQKPSDQPQPLSSN